MFRWLYISVAFFSVAARSCVANAETIFIQLDEHRAIEVADVSISEISAQIRNFHWHFVNGQTPATYAQAIQEIYRQDGYVLTEARFVRMKNKNTAIIQVDEGEIGSVRISGLSAKNERLALDDLSHLIGKKPISNKDMERAIALINDMAGVSVTTHLTFPNPSVHVAELVVTGKEISQQGVVAVDNVPGELGHQTRFNAVQYVNSTLLAGDQLKVSGALVTGQDITPKLVGGAGYRFPVNSYGTYGETHINMTRIPGSANYNGVSMAAVAGHPIIRDLHEYMYVIGHVERMTESVNVAGVNNNQVNVARLTGIYNFSSSFGSATKFRLTMSAGEAANYYNAQNPSYLLADHFAHLRGAVGHIHQIDWLVPDAQIRFEAYGQISNQRLPDSESFYLGGEQYLRGYSYATVRADSGYAGTVELAKSFFVSGDWIKNVTPYAFFDHGRVSNRQDVSVGLVQSRPANQALSSLGAGARAQFAGGVNLTAFLGVPLNRDASSGKLGPMGYFSLSKGW